MIEDIDRLKRNVRRWNEDDKERASGAAETRGEIGAYLDDEPKIHKRALADVRRIDRMDPEKRSDYLRSLDALIEAFRPDWSDGQDELPFEASPREAKPGEASPDKSETGDPDFDAHADAVFGPRRVAVG